MLAGIGQTGFGQTGVRPGRALDRARDKAVDAGTGMQGGSNGAGWRAAARLTGAAGLLMLPGAVSAQPLVGTIDAANAGDSAWLIAASALALLAALPGLLLVSAARLQRGQQAGLIAEALGGSALVALLWIVIGYTLGFGGVVGGVIGAGNAWMLIGIANLRIGTSVPESAFVLFQLALALVALRIVAGAWAGRARPGWALGLAGLWSLIVYAPVAHWIWGGGWLMASGVRDFAGGIALFGCAGVSALVAALMTGRASVPAPAAPDPVLAGLGASLLWAGGFGLVGGAALTATDDAASAILNLVAAVASALLATLITGGRTSRVVDPVRLARAVGAGLAGIAAGAGFVSPGAAILIGIVAALVSLAAQRLVEGTLGIDDRLHGFAGFGAPGLAGALIAAPFIGTQLGGTGFAPGTGMLSQAAAQLIGIGAVALWSILGTLVAGYGLAFALPMRLSADAEAGAG